MIRADQGQRRLLRLSDQEAIERIGMVGGSVPPSGVNLQLG